MENASRIALNTTDKEMRQLLRDFRDSSHYEEITIKNKIKEELLNDHKIIHALNASDLDENTPSDYYGKYILPYYMIPDTQTKPNHYICYDTSFNEIARYNSTFKLQQVTFYILCCISEGAGLDQDTGLARHDLLAALIVDRFNYTNLFGTQIHVVENKSRPVDKHFCARTVIFEQTTPNSIYKNGIPVNKIGGGR